MRPGNPLDQIRVSGTKRHVRIRASSRKRKGTPRKNLFAAFAVLLLLSSATAFADHPKAAEPAKVACCSPKCELKDGKCVTHEAKKCAKDCAAPCCKPPAAPEHPKGEHPK